VNDTTNKPIKNVRANSFSEATVGNSVAAPAAEAPAAEDRASQRPALKQKASNIQYPTNIFKSKQEKRGVGFAAGLISSDQQPTR
jgi:hypothetical protein